MESSNRTLDLINIICEKAALLDALKEWKIINLNPNVAELKFDITLAEIGKEISDELDIEDFKVKFLYNSERIAPLFNVSSMTIESSGKVKSFVIGAWIHSRDFETNEKIKVYLRIMLEHIIKYEKERKIRSDDNSQSFKKEIEM